MELDLILNCDTVIIDLDGVVYKGEGMIKGANIGIDNLRKSGKKIKFLTNSSAIGSKDIVKKINSFGIHCNKEDVMTSATASAIYLFENGYKNIYIVGSEPLSHEVRSLGMNVTKNPESADALLVGIDRKISYEKISNAMLCINLGCHFVACNRDSNYPVESGRLLPGCGPIVASIECASEKKIDFHVGKPEIYMLEKLLHNNTTPAEKILIVGDSIKSDIGLAKKYNTQAVHIDNNYSLSSCTYKDSYFRFPSIYHLGELISSY